MQYIATGRLKPHPKNREYFRPLDEEARKSLKEDIAARGIVTPILATPDLVVIAGHERLEIARELGLEQVPVIILDVSEEEAEELLIVENLYRRHLTEMDRARLVRVLKEKWGIRRGGSRKANAHNERLTTEKGMAEVAAALGVGESHARRLDRLNELIPELQALVAAGKLGVVAGEQLSYLTHEVQRQLYHVLGEELGKLKSEEIRRLRREVEAEIGARLREEVSQLEARLREAEEAKRKAEERLAGLARQAEEAKRSVEEARKRVAEAEEKAREAESRALRIAEENAAAVKAAQEAAQREIFQANREIARLQKELAAKEAEVKAAVQRAARLQQERTEAEARAQAAEKEARSLRELYEAAGASEEQALLAHELVRRMVEFRQFVAGAAEVLRAETLTQDLLGYVVAEVRQVARLVGELEQRLSGAKPVNVVRFPGGGRRGGE